MSERTVELHPAWRWDCDECGKSNYCRAVVPCEMEGQWPDDLDPELCHGVEWYMKPDGVECEHCGMAFEVEDDQPFGDSE